MVHSQAPPQLAAPTVRRIVSPTATGTPPASIVEFLPLPSRLSIE